MRTFERGFGTLGCLVGREPGRQQCQGESSPPEEDRISVSGDVSGRHHHQNDARALCRERQRFRACGEAFHLYWFNSWLPSSNKITDEASSAADPQHTSLTGPTRRIRAAPGRTQRRTKLTTKAVPSDAGDAASSILATRPLQCRQTGCRRHCDAHYNSFFCMAQQCPRAFPLSSRWTASTQSAHAEEMAHVIHRKLAPCRLYDSLV